MMQSFENLPSDMESSVEYRESKDGATGSDHHLSGSQMDAILLSHEQGVEVALHRAKLWSKYAKVIMTYVEKRCHLEMDIARKVAALAQTMKAELKSESYLPFQSVYITAMDREIENSNSAQSTCSLLTGHKFIEVIVSPCYLFHILCSRHHCGDANNNSNSNNNNNNNNNNKSM